MPFGKTLRHTEAKKPGCDWLGINYYGRCAITVNPKSYTVNPKPTGSFTWSMPLGKTLRHTEAKKPGCDWMGINYYGRCALTVNPNP